jgi:heme/copper-type cytochrome/quinol oxidase subunit 2
MAGAALAGCSSVFAQCSMCRTAAAAQNAKAAEAFNVAVVILLAPAVILFSGVFVWTIRRRDSAAEETYDAGRRDG